MSIRLHAIGFPAVWTAETAASLATLAEKSRIVTVAKGNYRVWRSRDGAELWFHEPMRRQRRAVSSQSAEGDGISSPRADIITPFHRGCSTVDLRIARILALDRSSPLEGSCLAWLPKTAHGIREQAIVMELVPYARHVLSPPPFIATAQIACFAHAVWAFGSVQEYAAATPIHRRIKSGAYAPATPSDIPEVEVSYGRTPVTLGLACGRVEQSIRHVNPVTGSPYYWLALATRRGIFDVLVNPTAVMGDISEGSIAQVYGSFLARFQGTPAS